MSAEGGGGFLAGLGLGIGGGTIGRAVLEIVGDNANLRRKMEESRGIAAAGTASMSSNVARMATFTKVAFAAVGAAAVLGIGKAVGTTQQLTGEVRTLSRATGLAAEDASKLRAAGAALGVDVQKLATGFGILSKHLVANDAMMQKYGISMNDAQGKALPFDEILGQLSDRFNELPKGIEQSAFILNVFGRSGRALIPLLARGRDGLKELTDEAERLGVVFSQDDLDASRELAIAQRELHEAFQGLAVQLGKAVIPLLTTAAHFMTALLKVILATPGPIKTLVVSWILLKGAMSAVELVGGKTKGLLAAIGIGHGAAAGAATAHGAAEVRAAGLIAGSATVAAGAVAREAGAVAVASNSLKLYIANAQGAVVATRELAAAQATGTVAAGTYGAAQTAAGGAAAGGGLFGLGAKSKLIGAGSKLGGAATMGSLTSLPVLASGFVGYQIGKAIDDATGLSKKFAEALVPDIDTAQQDRDIDAMVSRLDVLKDAYREGTIDFSTFEKGVKAVNDEFGTGFDARGLISAMTATREAVQTTNEVLDEMASRGVTTRKVMHDFLHQTGQDWASFQAAAQKAVEDDAVDAFFTDQMAKAKDWRDGIARSFNGVRSVLESYRGDTKVTAKEIIKSFDQQLKAMARYGEDWAKVVERAKGVGGAKGLLDALSEMGLEGRGVVHALAEANDKEFAKIAGDWKDAQNNSQDLAHQISKALVGTMHDLINTIREALGLPPIQFKVDADTGPAEAAINDLITEAGQGSVVIGAAGKKLGVVHSGGIIGGPGGGPGLDQREVLVKALVDEFVVNPRSSVKYRRELEAINQDRFPSEYVHADYHTGGMIGSGTVDGAGIGRVDRGILPGIPDAIRNMRALAMVNAANIGGVGPGGVPGLAQAGGYVNSPWGLATPPADRYVRWVMANYPAAQNWGIYNRRAIAGTSTWSQHSWANAVDAGVTPGLGDALYSGASGNRSALDIAHLLWRVPNHYDHVHADFYPQGTGTPPYLHQGGPVRSFARGGVLDEPVYGQGARSGASYVFGEHGRETVTPGDPFDMRELERRVERAIMRGMSKAKIQGSDVIMDTWRVGRAMHRAAR